MQTPAKKLETDRVIAGAVEPLYQKQQQQQQLRKLALKKKMKINQMLPASQTDSSTNYV